MIDFILIALLIANIVLGVSWTRKIEGDINRITAVGIAMNFFAAGYVISLFVTRWVG